MDMIEAFSPLINLLSAENPVLNVLFVIVFLSVTHLGVKGLTHLMKKHWADNEEKTKKAVETRNSKVKNLSYLIDGVAIVIALIYLNAGLTADATEIMPIELPEVLSAILIAILGFIGIKLFSEIAENFLTSSGVKAYFRELGLSETALSVILLVIQGFLYLVLLQLVFAMLGIGDTFLREFITASSWAAALLIAGLLFYGFKDLFQNYAAGIYLKSSSYIRPGQEISMGEDTGEITSLSLFSTNIDTKDGNLKVVPNRNIMEGDIGFRKTKRDIETLDEIKNHFVAQNPSFCGPASIEMGLEIFGYRFDQEKIGEKAGCEVGQGTEKEDMIKAIEELTEDEVKAEWIPYDKITDLGDEFKTWFNDGALVIPNFYKPALFPEATTGHYVLSVGVEKNEILVMDPNPETGGVYYVDKDRLKEAMSEYDHKRGYIVMAPEGTTAHWRIEKDLIYSDRNYYDGLSKALESKLRKILRRGRVLKESTPNSIDRYMEKWGDEEPINRLWKPSKKEEEE